MLQIITIAPSRFNAYRNCPDFIQRHIFPGGMLPTAQIVEDYVTQAMLKVTGRESFDLSYARTLQDWRDRFLGSWPDIEALGFDTKFRRMWEHYLAYCETGFGAMPLTSTSLSWLIESLEIPAAQGKRKSRRWKRRCDVAVHRGARIHCLFQASSDWGRYSDIFWAAMMTSTLFLACIFCISSVM
ncbi:class I SAM-dependent methyltransferase [Bradyrhizobium sp. CCGB20]|uniref:class I SAM-dependent methyltransferase n=1 Tax=Bradyrhizobium sp. CCGB20 TaxID=2949633 RepID=UPI0020B3FFD9|nr:class I SAM-dependent methyltransferase [Bradyrhizobium sp. CCGB20]MCP3402773.1 class I SAM-dependent methyltransferase [Bradyrhizobium sp. CCGB20]